MERSTQWECVGGGAGWAGKSDTERLVVEYINGCQFNELSFTYSS
jgi:hypothetical protein